MRSSTSNLSSHQLNVLQSVLRTANGKYRYLASKSQQSICYTHHAKARAFHLGLSINILKARNCPQRQISIIPLPILDLCPSPTKESLIIKIPSRNIRKESRTVQGQLSTVAPQQVAPGTQSITWAAASSQQGAHFAAHPQAAGSDGSQAEWWFDISIEDDESDYDGDYDLQYPSSNDMDFCDSDRLSDSDVSLVTPEDSRSDASGVIRLAIKRKSPEPDNDNSSPDMITEKRPKFFNRSEPSAA